MYLVDLGFQLPICPEGHAGAHVTDGFTCGAVR